jgi:hypothetical protein
MNMKLNAAARLTADSPVIAPSESFKHSNEEDFKERKSDSQHKQEKKEAPGLPETGTEASSTAVSEGFDLPQTDAQYATKQGANVIKASLRLLADRLHSGTEDDPLTMDMEDSGVTEAADTSDGDVFPLDYGFNMVGEEGNTNYMNVQGAKERIESDADPKIFGVGSQPLG